MLYTPLSVLRTFAHQLAPQHSGSYYETLPLGVESGHKPFFQETIECLQ